MKKPVYNSFLFGLLAGILLEIIAFFLVLFINTRILGYTERSIFSFLKYLLDFDTGKQDIIPKLISLSALPALLLFFIFMWTNKLKSARGVIGSAFILGIVIVFLKFIL
ncbi:MAG: hypothetical protein H6540_05885 [Bacteroidales bacterium]|nr:hypothetical protein [Bacteroidales bacterium]MCB9013652.1 hypothetical protein [Bacteroidales bacterium]